MRVRTKESAAQREARARRLLMGANARGANVFERAHILMEAKIGKMVASRVLQELSPGKIESAHKRALKYGDPLPCNMGAPRMFTIEEEAEITKMADEADKSCTPLTPHDIQRAFRSILLRKDPATKTDKPSMRWVQYWIHDHPILAGSTSLEEIEPSRVKASDPEAIVNWMHHVYQEYNLDK